MAGRQTAILAVFVPFILIGVADGPRRGLRQAWPAALTAGLTFGICQFAVSNFGPYRLTDIGASLASAAAIVLLLRAWSPAGPARTDLGGGGPRPAIAGGAVHDPELERAGPTAAETPKTDSRRDVWLAYAPYVIVIAIFSLAQVGPIKDALAHGTWTFDWPGLDIRDETGEAVDTVYDAQLPRCHRHAAVHRRPPDHWSR